MDYGGGSQKIKLNLGFDKLAHIISLHMSALGFKVRVDPLLACFLTYAILIFTSGV